MTKQDDFQVTYENWQRINDTEKKGTQWHSTITESLNVGNFSKHQAEEKTRKDALEEEYFQKDMANMEKHYASLPRPIAYTMEGKDSTEEAMWKATLKGRSDGVLLYNSTGASNVKEACKVWKEAVLGCDRLQNWRKYQKPADDEITGPSVDEVENMRTGVCTRQKDHLW